MAANRVFLDTNVLVYAQLTLAPLHSAAVSRLQSLDSGGTELWVSRQILREYLAVMTRPGLLTGSIPIASLAADVRYFLSRFHIAEEGPAVTENLLALMATVPIAGKQVHDANIVATMQAYEITQLLTHNVSDFERFSDLIAVVSVVP